MIFSILLLLAGFLNHLCITYYYRASRSYRIHVFIKESIFDHDEKSNRFHNKSFIEEKTDSEETVHQGILIPSQ